MNGISRIIRIFAAAAALLMLASLPGCSRSGEAKPTAVQQAAQEQLQPVQNEFEAKLVKLRSDIDDLRAALNEAQSVLDEFEAQGMPALAGMDALLLNRTYGMVQLEKYASVGSSFSADNESELDLFIEETEQITARLRGSTERVWAELAGLAAPTEAPAPEIPDDEWTVVTLDYTDPDGYQLTVTVRYSRVYPSSMYSDVETLWSVIGRGNTLPNEGAWGFTHYEGGIWSLDCGTLSIESPRHNIYTAANDLYYMVGTVQFENHTQGWSFSESNPGKPKLYIISDSTTFTSYAVGRVFYKSSYQTYDAWIQVNPQMLSDRTTEIPFCLAFVEQYSPNYPNGRYRSLYEQEGFLKLRPAGGTNTPIEIRFAEP